MSSGFTTGISSRPIRHPPAMCAKASAWERSQACSSWIIHVGGETRHRSCSRDPLVHRLRGGVASGVAHTAPQVIDVAIDSEEPRVKGRRHVRARYALQADRAAGDRPHQAGADGDRTDPVTIDNRSDCAHGLDVRAEPLRPRSEEQDGVEGEVGERHVLRGLEWDCHRGMVVELAADSGQ